jgi:hypothetical protein
MVHQLNSTLCDADRIAILQSHLLVAQVVGVQESLLAPFQAQLAMLQADEQGMSVYVSVDVMDRLFHNCYEMQVQQGLVGVTVFRLVGGSLGVRVVLVATSCQRLCIHSTNYSQVMVWRLMHMVSPSVCTSVCQR